MSTGIRLKYIRSLEVLSTLEQDYGDMQDRLERDCAQKADQIAMKDGRIRELEAKLVELEAALRQAAANDEAERNAAEALMAKKEADRRAAKLEEELDASKQSAAARELEEKRKVEEAFNHGKELEALIAKLRDGQAAAGSQFTAELASAREAQAAAEAALLAEREALEAEKKAHAATRDELAAARAQVEQTARKYDTAEVRWFSWPAVWSGGQRCSSSSMSSSSDKWDSSSSTNCHSCLFFRFLPLPSTVCVSLRSSLC